ncbi:MAG: ferrous iron transport protein A [Clostridia bacterium]|nr:ferrous iron transport protein A [Clostridia bacterium]
MTLDELAIGKTATIKAVGGEGPLRLRFLDMGLIPRTHVTMQKMAPMGDPIEISVRGYELTLRKADAKCITLAEEEGAR